MRRGLMAAVLFATFALTGCGTDSAGKSADQQLQVTATTSQIADAAENIGGKHVKVTSLMGPGVDPHLYKASQGDTKKLMSADVVLYSGLHLEGKMEDVLQKIGEQQQSAAVAVTIPKNKLIPAGEGKTFDPHVWLSIPLWIYAVDEIEAQFSKAMPQHADAFRKNAKEYKEDLQYLDKWSRKEIAHIPEKSRVLVTAHDAFAYFGNEYGFKVKSAAGTQHRFGLWIKGCSGAG